MRADNITWLFLVSRKEIGGSVRGWNACQDTCSNGKGRCDSESSSSLPMPLSLISRWSIPSGSAHLSLGREVMGFENAMVKLLHHPGFQFCKEPLR